MSYRRLCARFLDLYLRRLYSIGEIESLDLLSPRLTREDLDRRQSKEAQLRVQLGLNPRQCLALTENKIVFQTFCQGAGLSTPKYFGAFIVPPAAASEARRASARADAAVILKRALAPELILKPAGGVYGQGIVAVRVVDDGFIRDGAPPRSAEELHDTLDAGPDTTDYIVQQRLDSHPEIVRLTGSRSLQTIRMVTYVTSDRAVVIGCCQFRIIVGSSTIDNFRGGRSGNLLGDIAGARGIVSKVFGPSPAGPGLVTLSHHPATGIAFAGFPIPRWHEACELVKDAALAFLPLRTVGWDIGITGNGVFLIEGNATWDTAYEGDVGAEILDAVLADQRAIAA